MSSCSTRAPARWSREISLNVETGGTKFNDSYAVDVKLSGDGRYLYCADVTNFRLAVVDTVERRAVGSVAVGRYPYALAVAGDRVLVANIGLFEYSAVPPPQGGGSDSRGLTRPAFGYPSKEARDGVEFEGRKIAGLGDDNVPEAFSVWSVDVSSPSAPQIAGRWKTGLLIHSPADNGKTVGGSAPNFLAVRGNALYVSNGNNDMIERIDLRLRAKWRRAAASSRHRWLPGCAAWDPAGWPYRPMAAGSTWRRAESMRSACSMPQRSPCSAISRRHGIRTAWLSRRTDGGSR